MSTVIEQLEQRMLRDVPVFKAGDTVRVHFKVIEGQRQRIQVFEGIVIKRQGSGVRETFTTCATRSASKLAFARSGSRSRVRQGATTGESAFGGAPLGPRRRLRG